MQPFNHRQFRSEDEIDANAFYLAGYDADAVSGLPADSRRYGNEPALDARLEIADEPRELVYDQRPRSHLQPAVKVKKDHSVKIRFIKSRSRKVGDVIAFLFLAFGFCMILLYLGAFKVIGAVIQEAMQ